MLLSGCGNGEGTGTGSEGSAASGGASGAGNAAGAGGQSATGDAAAIQMRLQTPTAPSGPGSRLLALTGGGAVRPGLESLEYFILSVRICESIDVQGSGAGNETGCLELYHGDRSALPYELDGDWTSLADAARGLQTGFVDLLSPASRAALAGTTELAPEHVRSYNYGIITWSLPIKVRATLALGDGAILYTHDGETTFETIGVDNFRDYFTSPASALDVGPAETAVVLLGNGGNWFKFQNPLDITQADIDEKRQWVLDLVFNPEGIVKGFAGDSAARGNLRERDEAGNTVRAITVPMLDLAPIPHRASEQVVRESYLARVNAGAHVFDARIELYSVDGDPSRTVYGVDTKTLIAPESTSVPPELSKISYVVPQADGTLSFQSYDASPIITGFRRVTEELGTTPASIKCATHGDRAGAEGGAAIMLDSCPAPSIDVTFTLMGRSTLDGDIPSDLPVADAGAEPADAARVDAADGGP